MKPKEFADYTPIRSETITVDSLLEFDLYQDSGGTLKLYRDRNYPFSKEDLDYLLEHGNDFLYIPDTQQNAMFDHLRKNLPRLLEDETIPIENKLKMLSATSVNILGRVLSNPMSPTEIRGVVEQCENHVTLAVKGREAQNGMAGCRPQAPFPIAHAISVGNLSMLLGLKCKLTDPTELHELGTGALLHEIGKTIIERDYYYQPALRQISDNPRLAKYPLVGRDMLENTNIVPRGALRPVVEHQERLDGSGFPQSLKDAEIGLMGRIVAICDHYDEAVHDNLGGMTRRPFDVLAEMKNLKGKFDCEVLVAFIRLLGDSEKAK